MDDTAFVTLRNIRAVAQIVVDRQDDPMVIERRRRNVDVPGEIKPGRETLWRTLVMCLLTSQQRSSTGAPIQVLFEQEPFPLGYDECRQAALVAELARRVLQAHGGIRFSAARIPGFVADNWAALERGAWSELSNRASSLLKRRRRPADWQRYASDSKLEEECADYVDDQFSGFGPKQSRNFWQWMGLTRYVCVIDSRVRGWCVDNLEGPWDRFAVIRRTDYKQMAALLQEICYRADVLPCLFDAAVFSTFERESGVPDAWCRGGQ